jgi:hypothetical protein
VEALQVLGQLKGITLGGFEGFIEYSKQALAVANQATPDELEQKIFLNDSYDVRVGDVLEDFWWRSLAMLNVAKASAGCVRQS